MLTLLTAGLLLACGTAAPQDTPAPLPAQDLAGVPQAEPTFTPAPAATPEPAATVQPDPTPESTATPEPTPTLLPGRCCICWETDTPDQPSFFCAMEGLYPDPTPKYPNLQKYLHRAAINAELTDATAKGNPPTPTPTLPVARHIWMKPGKDPEALIAWARSQGAAAETRGPDADPIASAPETYVYIGGEVPAEELNHRFGADIRMMYYPLGRGHRGIVQPQHQDPNKLFEVKIYRDSGEWDLDLVPAIQLGPLSEQPGVTKVERVPLLVPD